MASGWYKAPAVWIRVPMISLGLLALLSACQPGPSSRSYGQPVGYRAAYDPCQTAPYGCDVRPRHFTSSSICPPGYRLVRMSYRLHGRSARDCVPKAPRQVYRYAGGPPHGVGYGDGCGRSCGDRGYRAVDRRPVYRASRRNPCCY